MPIKKEGAKSVGRSIWTISDRTGFAERTTIRHLKRAGVKKKLRIEYLEEYNGDYEDFKKLQLAFENEGKVLFSNEYYGEKVSVVIQKSNFYKFTGIEKYSIKNPIQQKQIRGCSVLTKRQNTHHSTGRK